MLNAKKVPGGGVRAEALEPGSYPARLVQVIGLGVQPQSYAGEVKDPKYQMSVTYELLDEFLKDEDGEERLDKPRWVSEDFPLHNLGAEKAKSTARYMTIDPNLEFDGDWAKLVGKPIMVTLVQNAGKGRNAGKVFNNVSSISPMRAKEAANAPELVNEPKVFDPDDPDMDVFNSLPDFLKEKIMSNLEYEGSKLAALVEGGQGNEEDKEEDWQ